MSNVSFFAKKQFKTKRGYLARVSSTIRAEQIAPYIGAKINPEKDFEDDVCIYVKPHVKRGDDFNFQKKSILDIVDGWDLAFLAQKHPEVVVLACSKKDYETLKRTLPNKVVFIPQHNCNFEKTNRDSKDVLVAGIIGTPDAALHFPPSLKEELAKYNVELFFYSHFRTRLDIVEFYKKIDIQIIWRPYMRKNWVRLSNPLKIVNASSFGIPTIALQEEAFNEMEGCYFPVENLNELLSCVERLKTSRSLYDEYKNNCRQKAEEYHISSVIKLYSNLILSITK